MTGAPPVAGVREQVLGAGAGGPLTAPSPWISYKGWIQYPEGVVIGNPAGLNKGDGTLNAMSYYINGVLVDLSKYVLWAGGTMLGMLTLNSDPVGQYDAATKRYVDNKIAAVNGTISQYLPLLGGTLTGPLIMSTGVGATVTLAADPVNALEAATKQYVDSKTSGFIGIVDAPADGTNYSRNNNAWTNSLDLGTF